VAGGADHGGFALLVAVDTGFHAVVHFLGEFGSLVDRAVAAGAFHGSIDVAGVTKKDVVGETIDALRGELGVLGMIGVAGAASGGLGETGALGFGGSGVAAGATELERSVRLMGEDRGGSCRPGGYGSE